MAKMLSVDVASEPAPINVNAPVLFVVAPMVALLIVPPIIAGLVRVLFVSVCVTSVPTSVVVALGRVYVRAALRVSVVIVASQPPVPPPRGFSAMPSRVPFCRCKERSEPLRFNDAPPMPPTVKPSRSAAAVVSEYNPTAAAASRVVPIESASAATEPAVAMRSPKRASSARAAMGYSSVTPNSSIRTSVLSVLSIKPSSMKYRIHTLVRSRSDSPMVINSCSSDHKSNASASMSLLGFNFGKRLTSLQALRAVFTFLVQPFACSIWRRIKTLPLVSSKSN